MILCSVDTTVTSTSRVLLAPPRNTIKAASTTTSTTIATMPGHLTGHLTQTMCFRSFSRKGAKTDRVPQMACAMAGHCRMGGAGGRAGGDDASWRRRHGDKGGDGELLDQGIWE